MELWKPAPDFKGWYEVSSHGRVRRIRQTIRGRALTVWPLPYYLTPLLYRKGYLKIHFGSCDRSRKPKRQFLHRLVWASFNGPIPEGLTINHKDGDKANNRLDNLELATHQEQNSHARAIGLLPPQRMTPELAAEVRAFYNTGTWTLKELARVYDVSESFISQIIKKRKWSRLAPKWHAL